MRRMETWHNSHNSGLWLVAADSIYSYCSAFDRLQCSLVKMVSHPFRSLSLPHSGWAKYVFSWSTRNGRFQFDS